MDRYKIIEKIGTDYLTANIENGEFSYPKALKEVGKTIAPDLVTSISGTVHQKLDIRFLKGNITIIVETKDNFDKWSKDEIHGQIQAYVNYEKVLTGNKIVAVLANTLDDRIKVWWGSDLVIDDSHQLKNQYLLKTFEEYADLYSNAVNDKEQVVKNTYALNEMLHKHGISEKIRSQLVGTCLLALKYDLKYEGLSTKQIIGGIEEVISSLLDKDLKKAEKLTILKTKVLENQDISSLKKEELQEIIRHVQNNIMPFVNDKNKLGQDILNLFFTTFNKYVGKADKNQAFTPDHIVHLMCQVVGVNRHSKILDPCCGSGAFLVRAMTDAIDDCANNEEQEIVKKKNIFGIEFEETAFGLATTNMLIHGDGNSNVKQGSCFELEDFIKDAKIDVVLMNPPYNAQRKHCLPEYVKTWAKDTKQDPSQGFHFVHYIASKVKTGKLAVLLPMQCAIGSSKDIKKYKDLMLKEHTLDAVFSLPPDIFHPGANASSCCMVFNLGQRHDKSHQDTFFGYFKEDGFVKKKNLGRVERTKPNSTEGIWADVESGWLELYRKRAEKSALSVVKKVTEKDEWLAEAYVETDYSRLSSRDFEKAVREYASFNIKIGGLNENKITISKKNTTDIDPSTWIKFRVDELFHIEPTRGTTTDELIEGDDLAYIAAKKDSNGLEMMCKKEGNEEFISKGNCIVFVQLGQGSAGYVTYQERDFIGMSGKTACGYNDNINKYNGLFLVAILDLERPKFSFGRSWTGERLNSTSIKLPAKRVLDQNGMPVLVTDGDGNISGKMVPDWDLMEQYIKALPYSDLI
ncbi:N-6 DNA methylase [Methylotenera sp.]|uniref:N-6 DNA methylase n=1 Tax=Methylotenera sp. TaxID=2051956 RepID=UPI0027361322|nr:N-6 DNA methylase [Methylotenera sp.]MDP3210608.1 N-6 DNA methylase [Methylotenera sp.]